MSILARLVATLAVALAPAAAAAADPVPKPHVFKRVVAVAVGIDRYPNLLGAADLRFAENDAGEFAKLMTDRYGYESKLLLGSKGGATKKAVLQTLKAEADRLGDEDALIVYFSGHGQVIPTAGGGEAGYLIPSDAALDLTDKRNQGLWDQQALDMQAFTDIADRSKARHVVLLVDACCSGFLTKQKGALDRWDLKTLMFEKSRTVLTATTQRQAAMEDVQAKHGYFTDALLTHLRAAECASVDDVAVPIRRDVAAKTSGRMTPQFKPFGEGDGMFVFIPKDTDPDQLAADLDGRVLEEVPPTAKGLKGVAARARDRQTLRTTYEQFLECVFAHNDIGYPAQPERHRDWVKRFERFQENATVGDVWAAAALHYCYHRGLGTERSPVQALAWAKRADEFQKPAGVGRFLLGRCYDLGVGVDTTSPDENARKARDLLVESADAGFAVGQWAAAAKLLDLKPNAEESKRIREWLGKSAKQGFPTAKVLQARLLFTGEAGTTPDRTNVVPLLEAAAGQGCPTAKFALCRMLTGGSPGLPPKDPARARRMIFEAADAGEPNALFWLSAEYLTATNDSNRLGLGLPTDDREARTLMERAADQGFPAALNQSYKFHARGVGGSVNLKFARERLDAAAAQDNAWAYFEQGNVYYLASGGIYEQSFEKAFTAFSRAAAKQHAPACGMLGRMYERGEGFKREQQDGDDYYAHYAMHWLTEALRLDGLAEVRLEGDFAETFGQVRQSLKSFRGRLETREPSAIAAAARWSKDFPTSYRYFCDKFDWRAK